MKVIRLRNVLYIKLFQIAVKMGLFKVNFMEIYIWTSSLSFHYITAKFNFLGIKNNETVCFGVIFIANFGRIKTLEYLISQDTKDLITIYERKSAIYQSILPTNYFLTRLKHYFI